MAAACFDPTPFARRKRKHSKASIENTFAVRWRPDGRLQREDFITAAFDYDLQSMSATFSSVAEVRSAKTIVEGPPTESFKIRPHVHNASRLILRAVGPLPTFTVSYLSSQSTSDLPISDRVLFRC